MFSRKRSVSPTPSYDSADEVKAAKGKGLFSQYDGPDTSLPEFAKTSGNLVYECTAQSHGHDSSNKWKFSTLNARYSIPSSGQTFYKTETARENFAPKCTLIQRIKPGSSVDEFETIATIHHKVIGPSTFEFAGGDKIPSDILMRKEKASNLKTYGYFGRDRIVTLPDGREARWRLGMRECTLVLNNESKRPLARFHRSQDHIFRKQSPHTLEFYPAVLSLNGSSSSGYENGILNEVDRKMVEFILVTWLYVEKLRKDRDAYNGEGAS
ncbi:hypothetical protein DL96DRAFT_1684292 [Flagelloscypha sp. PMI_526]|nr:hypothetical protein DL96DRAFT_1684292 [Flagelloscypha sp. PMI_526]